MAWDMRALYYVAFSPGKGENEDKKQHDDAVKANENCLNQNFTILTQKLEDMETRLRSLESGG